MNLDPARRARHILAMVLGPPTFHKTHPDGAHLGELEHGAVAVVHRLKSHHNKSKYSSVFHCQADSPG